MWGELAKDASGILLFLAWLVLPPLYQVLIGRKYARQCADAAQEAVWAREDLRQALEDVEDFLSAQQPHEPSDDATGTESPAVPRAREDCADDTEELRAVGAPASDRTGRHRIARSRLVNANA